MTQTIALYISSNKPCSAGDQYTGKIHQKYSGELIRS